MKPIMERIYREPAVFIGLLVTIALTVGAVLTDSGWGWETIVAVLAPLLSALGIRSQVTPNTAPDGTTYRPPPPVPR